MKKIIIIFALLVFSIGASIASPIYDIYNEEQLSNGVKHEHILRFQDNGWLNINIIRIDLDDEYTDLDLLYSPNGVSTKTSLRNMVNQNEDKDNIVAAINADYFYLLNPDSPLGIMAKEGEMISSPIIVDDFLSFALYQNNPMFTEFIYEIEFYSTKGEVMDITTINKKTHGFKYPMLIDENFSNESIGNKYGHNDMVELVVKDGVIIDKRVGRGPTAIPKDGYIILATEHHGQRLDRKYDIGDIVGLNIKMDPNLEDLDFAVGGGIQLVENGSVVAPSGSWRAPKSGIGISKDNKEIILMTVDGRTSSYPGVNNVEFANIFLEFGAYNAINLDGGGSTTLGKKELGKEDFVIINNPSGGTQRHIINGIGVINNSPKTDIGGIIVDLESDRGIKNIPIDFKVSGYDKNYHPYSLNKSDININVLEGEAEIKNGYIIPKSDGNLRLAFSYEDISKEKDIYIEEKIAYLDYQGDYIFLEENSKKEFSILLIDNSGYRFNISSSLIEWQSSDLVEIQNGVIISSKNSGSDTIIGNFNGNKVEVPVVVGYNEINLNMKYENLKFNSYPSKVKGDIFYNSNESAIGLNYDFSNAEGTKAAYLEFKEPMKIGRNVNKLKLDINSKNPSSGWVRGNLVDSSGNEYVMDFTNRIDWSGWNSAEGYLPKAFDGELFLTRLYVVEVNSTNKYSNTLMFKNLTMLKELEPINVSTKHLVSDPLNYESSNKGFNIIVSTEINKDHPTLLDSLIEKRHNDILNNSDMNIILGDSNKSYNSNTYILGDRYRTIDKDDLTIININNSNNGIRNTYSNQWRYFINKLETTDNNNIIVFLNEGINSNTGFPEPLEKKLFIDLLEEEGNKGKNVFVIYEDSSFNIDYINGVRYIGLESYDQTSKNSNKFRFIEFNIYEGELNYIIKEL